METLASWGNREKTVDEKIRDGAFKHFRYYLIEEPRQGLCESNLFLMANNPNNGEIYGVADAFTDSTPRAISGYGVRLNGPKGTGTILISEKLKTLFSLPDVELVEGMITSVDGRKLLEKFYFGFDSEENPYLLRSDFERLQKDHPEFFT